jgi:hypothetical protein
VLQYDHDRGRVHDCGCDLDHSVRDHDHDFQDFHDYGHNSRNHHHLQVKSPSIEKWLSMFPFLLSSLLWCAKNERIYLYVVLFLLSFGFSIAFAGIVEFG